MNTSGSIAVLQIIPNHHDLLPARLIKALAMLDELGCPYGFYDIERSPERDFRLALMKLFVSIKEDTILVSMACHNNYPKIESLIFLYLYLPLLENKRIIICSAYFSLYETALIHRENVTFSPLDIDEYVAQNIGEPRLPEDVFFERLGGFLERYGYQGSRFWSYLTFGCYAKCTFCYNRLPSAGAPAVTRRSPEDVLRWMAAGKRHGKTYFEFSEPNFLADRRFTLPFLDRLAGENPGVTWRCKTRLDDIDPQVYDQMRAAGCRTIFFGVEHVDALMLERVRKGEDSAQLLEEFLGYRQEETTIHLSFLTGIRGETGENLRRNLEMVMRMGSLKNVDPNIGWQILFDRKNRGETVPNYIIPFMFALNFLPKRMDVSPALMRDILRLCLKEPFFDFWFMTEAGESLSLMQQLIIFLKARPGQRVIRDYDRLLDFQGGALTKLILKCRTVEDLNSGVLSLMEV